MWGIPAKSKLITSKLQQGYCHSWWQEDQGKKRELLKYGTSKGRCDFIITVNINANLSLKIPKLCVSYCLNSWDVALDWFCTVHTLVQTLLQPSTSASKAPVALKIYICNMNQLSNRNLNKLQYALGSKRSALSTENSLLIAELLQCGQKCNTYKLSLA